MGKKINNCVWCLGGTAVGRFGCLLPAEISRLTNFPIFHQLDSESSPITNPEIYRCSYHPYSLFQNKVINQTLKYIKYKRIHEAAALSETQVMW